MSRGYPTLGKQAKIVRGDVLGSKARHIQRRARPVT